MAIADCFLIMYSSHAMVYNDGERARSNWAQIETMHICSVDLTGSGFNRIPVCTVGTSPSNRNLPLKEPVFLGYVAATCGQGIPILSMR